MKIYTKKGDQGETSLLGGERVSKGHARIEAYGTVDELNSHLGLLRAQMETKTAHVLEDVQNDLFAMGSRLAARPDTQEKMSLPTIRPTAIQELEVAIDAMNEELDELRSFILPGSSPLNAQCHIARCICRRAERRVVELNHYDEEQVDDEFIQYLNRLSDYLFVLSRKISADLGVRDIEWKPAK